MNTVERAAEPVTIDGNKIDELLEQLNEADPTCDQPDSDQLLALEGESEPSGVAPLVPKMCRG